jgi:FMN-dependent NADH-azoreductase
MSTLLHIQSSPNGSRSTSRQVARTFLDTYATHHPADDIVGLDLWTTALPELDATFVSAQYKVLANEAQTEAERRVWQQVLDVCEQLRRADKVLVSCPMWNFAIPYKLKHYFDVICQPGVTFGWTPQDGYTGLVTDKPVQLILSRAGAYVPPAANAWMDHQTNYLEFVFGFLGFTDVRTLTVEPTLLFGPDAASASIARAVEGARAAARQF